MRLGRNEDKRRGDEGEVGTGTVATTGRGCGQKIPDSLANMGPLLPYLHHSHAVLIAHRQRCHCAGVVRPHHTSPGTLEMRVETEIELDRQGVDPLGDAR
jgi:hypothetical protein